MKPHTIASRLWNLKLMMLVAFFVLCAVGIVTSTAQSAQDQQEERKFENTIPTHVPLKVKLKNEQSFKNMKNKSWARELEIEVKNTGSKPIYYLYMLVDLPEIISPLGYPYAIQIHYGRKELIRLSTPIHPDDVPILPGETYTLKISERQVVGYEASRDKERRADPKRVKFQMQLINFGDGTGLRSTQGVPLPDPLRRQSLNQPYVNGELDHSPPASRSSVKDLCYRQAKSDYSLIPANFMRVNFSLRGKDTSISTSSIPDLCGCQNTFNCFYGTLDYATCPCDDPEAFTAFIPTSCSHPLGYCALTETRNESCATQYNGTQYCQFQTDVADCRGTTPTPTGDPAPTPYPTPTPTPTPCDPDPATRPNPSCQPFGPCPPQGTQARLLA